MEGQGEFRFYNIDHDIWHVLSVKGNDVHKWPVYEMNYSDGSLCTQLSICMGHKCSFAIVPMIDGEPRHDNSVIIDQYGPDDIEELLDAILLSLEGAA